MAEPDGERPQRGFFFLRSVRMRIRRSSSIMRSALRVEPEPSDRPQILAHAPQLKERALGMIASSWEETHVGGRKYDRIGRRSSSVFGGASSSDISSATSGFKDPIFIEALMDSTWYPSADREDCLWRMASESAAKYEEPKKVSSFLDASHSAWEEDEPAAMEWRAPSTSSPTESSTPVQADSSTPVQEL